MPPISRSHSATVTPAPSAPRSATGWSRWRVFLLAWLALSLVAVSWSIATPIGGAPDEPAHIIKAAAVVRGELTGENSPDGQKVDVPAYIAYTPAQTCYAYNAQAIPTCSAPLSGDPWKTTGSATTAGLYNPLYYVLVGWPSLIFHDESGVYAMRIVSGIVSSLFLALTLMLIATWRRRLLPVFGFAIAVTPMMFFLGGVVSPNALEATGTLAAFTAILSIVRNPAPRLLVERSVIAMVSAAVALNTRGISPLWVAIAVLSPFLLATWPQIKELAKKTAVRIAVVIIALAAACALAWTLLSNSLGAGLVATTDTATGMGVGASPLHGFAQVFAQTFDYGLGLVGVFGWLDTPVEAPVVFVWSAFIGVLVLSAIILLRGKALVFSLTLAAALVLLPPIVQALYINGGGIVWQGRYALALYVCVMVGLSAVLSERLPDLQRSVRLRLTWIVLGIWAVAQVHAFAFALKRYGVGATGTSWKRLLFDPLWAPPGGTILAIACCTVFIVFTGALLYRIASRENALYEAGSVRVD